MRVIWRAKQGGLIGLSRESRREFNELHAEVVYIDYETGEFLPGTMKCSPSVGHGTGRIKLEE